MNGTCDRCKKENVELETINVKMRGKAARNEELCEKCCAAYENYIDHQVMVGRGK